MTLLGPTYWSKKMLLWSNLIQLVELTNKQLIAIWLNQSGLNSDLWSVEILWLNMTLVAPWYCWCTVTMYMFVLHAWSVLQIFLPDMLTLPGSLQILAFLAWVTERSGPREKSTIMVYVAVYTVHEIIYYSSWEFVLRV